jgi:site-specific recombinase XerD
MGLARQDVAAALRSGPFQKYVDDFLGSLREQGYSASSLQQKRLAVAEFSRWLGRRRVGLASLDEGRLGTFYVDRRRRYRTMGGVRRTCQQLLKYLRARGALAPAPGMPRPSPAQMLEGNFAGYLREERGVAETTVALYLRMLRPFVAERCVGGRVRLAALKPSDVADHVLRHARVASVRHVKLRVTALRSFLRFLHVRGLVANDLAAAVPTVPNWRLTSLPRFIPATDVQRILGACDRRTASGRRDYAVLLLLARLGLRANEVARMTLDDIQWESAEIDVRGKGGQDRLPLPADVGKAIVEYLRRDRPRCVLREVFIGAYAPRRRLGVGAVSAIVTRTIRRAGVRTPTRGAHLLRHSLATHVLRHGGSLDEIGELLRHGSPQTTLLYAKVDVSALRGVSPAWPGFST